MFFDNDGHVTMVEESQKKRKHSEANLFVVPYGRYNLIETMPLQMMKHLDEEVKKGGKVFMHAWGIDGN